MPQQFSSRAIFIEVNPYRPFTKRELFTPSVPSNHSNCIRTTSSGSSVPVQGSVSKLNRPPFALSQTLDKPIRIPMGTLYALITDPILKRSYRPVGGALLQEYHP